MFGLFNKRKSKDLLNFSLLGADMHSHLIPGIDDGAKDLDTALHLVSKLEQLGFRKLITTPHVMADYYRNTPATIQKGLDVLREALHKNNIKVELEAAAEYYVDETFLSKLHRKEVLGFGKNYLLFEFSFLNAPVNLVEVLFEMQNAGFVPVLAHPERYAYFHGNIEDYHQLIDYGCLFQLNTLSLGGYYGKQVKKMAEELVDKNYISFLGTDVHHHRHADALKLALKSSHVQQLLAKGLLNEQL